jgi:hypothetical protein
VEPAWVDTKLSEEVLLHTDRWPKELFAVKDEEVCRSICWPPEFMISHEKTDKLVALMFGFSDYCVG